MCLPFKYSKKGMRKIFAFVLLVLALPSCVKEVDIFLPDTPILTNSEFNEFFQDIQPVAQVFQVSAHHDTTLSSTQGVSLFIPAGAFTTVEGHAVNGIVEVQLYQAFNKGKWVANRMSTTTQSALFEHLGAIQIEARQNNVNLRIAPSAKLRFNIPRGNNNGQTSLFRGFSDQENRILWMDINDQTTVAQNAVYHPGSQQWINTWQWETSTTGWFACGKYIDPPQGSNATFCITLPEEYEETNTAAFAVFQQNNSIIELEWAPSPRQFCTDFLPVGYTVTLLTISAKDQHHYLGYAETMVEAGGLSIPLQPIGTTPAIFSALLDEL